MKKEIKLTLTQKEYSRKRAEFDNKFLTYETKQLRKNAIIYDKVIQSSAKELKAFYGEFAQDSVVAYTEAIAPIKNKAKILKEIAQEIERVKGTGDLTYVAYLSDLQRKVKINRLDALNFQIQKNVHDLAIELNQTTDEYLVGAYERSYSSQAAALAELTERKIPGKMYKTRVQKAVFAEYNGLSFSDRIWQDKDKLTSSLRTSLQDMFVRQQHIEPAVKQIVERLEVNRSYAERIVRTEGARVTEAATKQAYQEAKIEKYQYDATMDERTSSICEELNGQIFLLSEAQEGVNYPPMHPNCRSTTIPVFDE